MSIPLVAPQEVHDQLKALPQNNVGKFYAKIKPPFFPFAKWYKVPVWGQVCDGRHNHGVGCFLNNSFPNRGRGWTYLEWRSEPDNPELRPYVSKVTSLKTPDPIVLWSQ